MKTYQTLIKMAKYKLDALRNDLAVFQERIDQLETHNIQLEESLKQETASLENNPDAQFAITNYTLSVRDKQTNNNNQIEQLQLRADALLDKIRIAYGEQKKYEIILEQKQAELAEEIAKKESATLDELGITNFAANIED